MKKPTIAPNILQLFHVAIFGCLLFGTSSFGRLLVDERFESKLTAAPMQMVLLTQKDYIQFLRWELPVPNIEEFTFCLWMRSDNLTYPHSILSYSKNERERLVRAWISAQGRSVHLEIGGSEVFRQTISLKENRWYHVCQSWENREGRFAMWLNGRIKAQGYAVKTVQHVIPSGGDIVLGQEYTDFDKGLEEGIEGAVLGFNFLLKSAFEVERPPPPPVQTLSRAIIPYEIPRFVVTRSPSIRISKLGRYYENQTRYSLRSEHPIISKTSSAPFPLGQQLVRQSYVRCELGRGSPRIGGSLMLISWSRTPVRVFGGATLKNARNDCGNF
ncbi:hypothetical protein KPH14_005063 [Odynerus spinipes]|uniref:Pentraxin (PTX) domain-containing protein n=1 Tax=Odynerus spinipes TaxID=1348599 RepID=A0AAD9VPJ5_9HYME|nr:hypothetical protein KPH14_005063 [Odynerus spinipes]